MKYYRIDLKRPVRFLMAGVVRDTRGHVHIARPQTDQHELFLVQSGVLEIEGNGIRSAAGSGMAIRIPRGARRRAPAPRPKR